MFWNRYKEDEISYQYRQVFTRLKEVTNADLNEKLEHSDPKDLIELFLIDSKFYTGIGTSFTSLHSWSWDDDRKAEWVFISILRTYLDPVAWQLRLYQVLKRLAGPKANLAARFIKCWLGRKPSHPCWLDDQARWLAGPLAQSAMLAAKFLIGW